MATRYRLLAAAFGGVLAFSSAYADDSRAPVTGSEQGEIVPNALPGKEAAHARIPEGHFVVTSGMNPLTGSAQGVESPNSVPDSRAAIGETQPHSDVTSPAGVVPNSNEGAPGQPLTR